MFLPRGERERERERERESDEGLVLVKLVLDGWLSAIDDREDQRIRILHN